MLAVAFGFLLLFIAKRIDQEMYNATCNITVLKNI